MNEYLEFEYAQCPFWVTQWAKGQQWHDEFNTRVMTKQYENPPSWQGWLALVYSIAREMNLNEFDYKDQRLILRIPITPETTALILKYSNQ